MNISAILAVEQEHVCLSASSYHIFLALTFPLIHEILHLLNFQSSPLCVQIKIGQFSAIIPTK